ncbi:MAG: alpha-amylase family glycosyl hydrolase [Lachnospira sp.]
MWYNEAVFYQIFPLGFCDGLRDNDGVMKRCISEVCDWIPHIKKLGADAIYFSPLFESDYHGYDTRDYRLIDKRIGTNEDFAHVVKELHDNGIKVVIDGVFNHVGRGFWAFKDVLEKKWDSPYKDWFCINFDGNSCYNDGFYYEGWEGYYNLVKLNLQNREVVDYLIDTIRYWIDEFDIDGIRFDVAYCLNHDFMKRVRKETSQMKDDFFMLGEMLHGDYNTIVNDEMMHSATNYECYKGLYSSFNSMNMFEIAHSINRQFGRESWCLYTGKHLLSFVDNHDVNRIASVLTNENHLKLIYALMISMPGIPCIYYGSEWAVKGEKCNGTDNALRPCFEKPEFTDLTEELSRIIATYKNCKALSYGDYEQKVITNRQYVFIRRTENEKVLVAINADDKEYTAYCDTECSEAVDMISGDTVNLSGKIDMEPFSYKIFKI